MTKVTAVAFQLLLFQATVSAQGADLESSSIPNTSWSDTIVQTDVSSGHVYTGGGVAFISDVTIPDGTEMSPNQSFTKIWKIRNSGVASWNDYNLVFVSGNQMEGAPFVSVPVTLPGATVEIRVSMVAPKEAGSHRGFWQMRTATGEFFGENVFILIQVKSSIYKERTFEEWEAELQAHSRSIRQKALEALRRFGTRATSVLIKTYRSDPNEEVRAMALAALADIKPLNNDVVRILLGATTNPSPSISTIANMIILEALPSKVSQETVPVLIELMHNASAIQREMAIHLLAHLGSIAIEAVPTMRELADHDPNPRVRSITNEALKLIEMSEVGRGNR